MGFFQGLGKLFDDLISWVGQGCRAFIESLMWVVERMWETLIVSALVAAFGIVVGLYVIFYAGAILGETMLEIWDPRYANSKPSQVFNVKQAPANSPLPTNRSSAQVLVLSN